MWCAISSTAKDNDTIKEDGDVPKTAPQAEEQSNGFAGKKKALTILLFGAREQEYVYSIPSTKDINIDNKFCYVFLNPLMIF